VQGDPVERYRSAGSAQTRGDGVTISLNGVTRQ